jgi:LuxR family maltose regulon positive regulatory protein
LANSSDIWIDARSLRQAAQAVTAGTEVTKNGESALKLYRGPFLEGINLPDCPEFDDWQFYHRQSFQNDVAMVLQQLTLQQDKISEWETAIDYARKWVALDKFYEPAQQALVQLYARSGQRGAALRQYDDYLQLLKKEFGQDPGPEIVQLYDEIRAGKLAGTDKVPLINPLPGRISHTEATGAPSPPSANILKTKLFIPRIPEKLVERKRVLEKLDLGVTRRLTLISAPAGYGKTTLLGSWVRRCPYPVAWLSLDANDNDPSHFIKYLAAALESVLPEQTNPQESQLPSSIFPFSSGSATSFLSSQLNQLCDLDSPVILMLDDYQFVSHKEVHDLTSFLIDKMPEQMHVVISSRLDLPFPIARLRAGGQVLEIRTTDVRFTETEIADFYHNVMQLELSQDDLSILEDRTEGWAAGLQMAALVMKGFDLQSRPRRDRFLHSFGGSHRFIMDYLVEEVLDRLPEEIKEFLLRTSILEKLSSSLCDSIVSSPSAASGLPLKASQEILENLEHSNYFVVPLDDEQAWFRYHHLFRDLLRARLEKFTPGLVADLHRRAARWYEQNGMVEDAIQHTRLIGDHEHTAALLELCIERMLNEGGLSTVMQWCIELPAEILNHHPWLSIEFLRGAYLKGTIKQYPQIFETVERYLQEHADSSQPRDKKMLAHFNVVKANRAFLDRDIPGTIQYGNLAAQQMARDSQVRQGVLAMVAYAWLLRGDMDQSDLILQELLSPMQQNSNVYSQTLSLCSFTRSFYLYTRGKLHQSYDLCEQTIETLIQTGKHHLPGAGLLDLGKSFTLAEWGRYEEAEPICKWALGNLESLGMPDFILLALECQVVIQRHLGESEQAEASLKRGWDFLHQVSVDPLKLAGFRHQQVLMWIAKGELDQAENLFQEIDLNPNDPIILLRDTDLISQVHIYIGRARKGDCQWFDRAERLLNRNCEMAEQSGWIPGLIENLALLAAVQKEQDREEEALVTLSRALVLAEPENFIHLFLEAGEPVHDLLSKMKAYPVSTDYIHRILARFNREKPALP